MVVAQGFYEMVKLIAEENRIDVTFDFTSDSSRYWDDFWNRNNGLGAGGSDPDASSKTLQKYHQYLWSRPLPNGETMQLSRGSGACYLTWRDFRFGSDSIIASFRYERYRKMLEQVMRVVPNYKEFIEDFLHRTYTVGGMIIFPKRMGGINQSRGCNPFIKDRWDLTLECIRKYYIGEESPLFDVLLKDKSFFDLFVDFKGYVDFFFLQDCVSEDCESVDFWLGNGEFSNNPLPRTVAEYLMWINKEVRFVELRNNRIKKFLEDAANI